MLPGSPSHADIPTIPAREDSVLEGNIGPGSCWCSLLSCTSVPGFWVQVETQTYSELGGRARVPLSVNPGTS